jgi:hypothetical protein
MIHPCLSHSAGRAAGAASHEAPPVCDLRNAKQDEVRGAQEIGAQHDHPDAIEGRDPRPGQFNNGRHPPRQFQRPNVRLRASWSQSEEYGTVEHELHRHEGAISKYPPALSA